MAETEQIQTLPLLPITQSVLFPYLLMPLSVGRPGSLAAVEAAIANEKELAIVAQREPAIEAPGPGDLYGIGTKAIINQVARRPDGTLELLVLGQERVALLKLEPGETYLGAQVRALPAPADRSDEV
jgi:ATP-dependent Lon protease